jgi:uncharacterized spore protein YtfJ
MRRCGRPTTTPSRSRSHVNPGFGAVGRHAALALRTHGAQVVAVADRSATIFDPHGLDVDDVVAFKRGQPLAQYPSAKVMVSEDVLTLDCDLLVPAAQPDVLHEGNAAQVRASVVLPGANIAATDGAEAALWARGVLCVPDFIANAGGVICAAVEYAGGNRVDAFKAIEQRIAANTAELLDGMASTGESPRAAAEAMAWARSARPIRSGAPIDRIMTRREEVGGVLDKVEPEVAVMDVLRRVVDNTTVGTVFGDPVTQNGMIVIPVARVRGAGGGGGGRSPSSDKPEASGTGGGIALSAKPVGVFVVKDGQVAWRPSVDVNKVILGGQLVAIVALLAIRALVNARRASRGT